MNVKDSNGNPLSDGDSVHLIKDLKVKGANVTLTNKPDEIECNAEKVKGLVLRTEFLKKA
jgi:protein PhnA